MLKPLKSKGFVSERNHADTREQDNYFALYVIWEINTYIHYFMHPYLLRE
jgi:hypothetical protein